jgi:diguanylate cyclase (GGDEF)-like protein/PAS domain S-box-containing protein
MNVLFFVKHLFLLLIIFASHLHALNSISLSEQEKLFLNNNRTIVLGSDSEWAPYVMTNSSGKVTGYDAEVLALINEVSGANFVLKLGKWKDITEAQKNREIDGLSTAVFTEERSLHSLFSNDYLSLDKIVFTRKEIALSINSISDLSGKKFAIYKGNSVSKAFANTIKDVEIIEFDSIHALIEGVTVGKADAMLGNGSMLYLLNKTGNPFLKPTLFLHNNPLNLVFVIRSDFPEAISIINKSLQLIGDEKLLHLKRKWFFPQNSIDGMLDVEFSKQELIYLQNKKELTLCIDPNWMPLEKIEEGQHIGMSADYFKIFNKNIDIPITLMKTKTWDQTIQFTKNKKCDLISLAMPTEERNTYLNFTNTLIKTPVVLATKPNITFVDDLALIENKKVGIIKNYAFNEIIRRQYPNIEVIDVPSAQNGLQRVVNGELFGYIDALATVGYMFQTKFIGELKISGKFDKNWEMSIATRKDAPLLLSIFNKLISKIPEQTHQDIFSHYIAINYKQGFDYQLFWKIMFVIFCLSLFFLYRYTALEKYNRRIKHHLFIIDNHILSTSSDKKGNITEVSTALCKLTGYKREELVGKNHNIFRHPTTENSIYKSLWSTITQGKVWQGEILNFNKNGSTYWANTKITPIYFRNGLLKGYTTILQDISDKKRLEKLSVTDTLTQIPNRLFINNSFEHEFERAKRYKNHFSLILIDIDNFKQVNDNYGHKVGDDVLINVATIVKQNIRQLDLLGRWGGEEFLIICPETKLLQAEMVAEKIREIIEQFEFSEDLKLTCSFGVTQSDPSDNKETVFHRADNALYVAKNSGRNQVRTEAFKNISL